uniref:Uncharacterized protein n=1 Tax=Kocuria rosea subsp. polaris TaxID=136273 RepID=A0A0A6VVX8_KOCRO|nr:hypothetical protein GY22_04365 [Kocuria polaris]
MGGAYHLTHPAGPSGRGRAKRGTSWCGPAQSARWSGVLSWRHCSSRDAVPTTTAPRRPLPALPHRLRRAHRSLVRTRLPPTTCRPRSTGPRRTCRSPSCRTWRRRSPGTGRRPSSTTGPTPCGTRTRPVTPHMHGISLVMHVKYA